MRNITGIFIHCTATRAEWWKTRSTNQKVAEVKRWHVKERGWSDIGYHYLIDRDGKVATGRPITRNGAHVRGHNEGTIGISLFGGHGSSKTDSFGENFTGDQAVALRKLIAELQAKYGTVPVRGHNEVAAKACPGFNVSQWMRVAGPKPAPTPPKIAPQSPTPPAPTPDRRKGFWAVLVAAVARAFNRKGM